MRARPDDAIQGWISHGEEDFHFCVPATYYGMSEAFPLEMLVAVTFEGVEGKTKLTLTHVGLPPGEDQDNCRTGWNESFDMLAKFLGKAQTQEGSSQ